MDEQYKVQLGVDIDVSDLQSQINKAGDKVTPISIKVEIENLNEIKKQLQNLGGTKGNSKVAIPIDTASIEGALKDVSSSIKEIKNAIGTLDSKSGMKSLLSSINQISSALDKASDKFAELNGNLNALASKDFNINFGINMGSSNQISRNTAYGQKARGETLPELQKQVAALENYLQQYYKVTDGFVAAQKLVQGTGAATSGRTLLDIVPKMLDTSGSLSSQMSAYKEYIALIKDAASLKGVDLSHITSQFSKSADQLVQDAVDVQTGANEMQEGFEKLRQIFGGGNNFNVEGLSQQLDSIVADLKEIKVALTDLSAETPLNNLSKSFTELSSSITQLIQNCGNVNTAINEIGNAGANAGVNVGNELANGFDSSMESVQASAAETSGVIENLKATLETMRLDRSSIDAITKDIEELGFEVTNASVKMKDGNFDITVKGVDSFGKAITEMRRLDSESKEISGLGRTISQSFSTSDDVVRELNKEMANFVKLQSQIGNMRTKIGKLELAGSNDNQVAELKRQLEELENTYAHLMQVFSRKLTVNADIVPVDDITRFDDEIAAATEKAENKLRELEAKYADTRAELAKDIKLSLNDGDFNVMSKINVEVNKLTGTYPKLTASIKEVKNAFRDMEVAAGTGDEVANVEKLIAAHERFEHALKNVNNQLKANTQTEKNNATAQKLDDDIAIFQSKIDAYLTKNSAAAKDFGAQLLNLKAQAQNCDRVTLNHLESEFKQVDKAVEAAGLKTKTFGDSLKAQFSKYSSYLSVASMFTYVWQGMRDMFQQVVAIDTAMTELKKVTDETDASYNQFLTNAASKSRELGTTIDGLVESTADFARLGYGFEESQGLAEVANIYAVVGDEIEGVEDATKSLISTMAAFKDVSSGISDEDFAMDIVDKFNEVSNNFAISSGGIGEAMQRSASSLRAANNTIDESIALITAANTVVQDPVVIGTSFKTISMRIRGAKTELEEAGLETDGMVESTATLRAEIEALSGVDIMEADGQTFKSTYAILDELAQKWGDLSDIQQATITELIAGKRQGNVISSLMQNFDVARNALETSLNSSGSAMAEHAKWSQSLEARLNKLKSAWQGLSQAFMKSSFLKGALDGVIGLVDGLTELIDTMGVLPTLATAFSIFQSFNGKGFFKPVIDEATGAAKGITSIFNRAANSVKTSLNSININNGFSASLKQEDIQALINYNGQLQANVDKTTAWNDCMVEASEAAQNAARSNEFLTGGLNGYIKSQQAANVSTLASNKSLGSAKALLKEYYSGCQATGMGVDDFRSAVQKTNPQLAAQMTATGGATKGLFAYAASTAVAKAGALALKIGVMALNATLTMGIGLIVGELISAITSWINKEEELAEKVEEVTSKFNEQHKELQKMKGDFDTSNESSMISKYAKLSKGVGGFNENISLTTDEYSEYKSIADKIANQFPELITGYDNTGTALLSCKDNVDALVESYEQLILSQSNAILTGQNSKDIDEDWENTIDQSNGYNFWESVGNTFATFPAIFGFDIKAHDMKTNTAEFLSSLTPQTSKEDIENGINGLHTQAYYEIMQALQNEGYDVSVYSGLSGLSQVLEDILEKEPEKIQEILNNYYAQFDGAVAEYKTKATALLTKAFNVRGELSGLNYDNISKELQSIAYQIVNSLDFEFLNDLSQKDISIEDYVKGVLDQLNSLSSEDNKVIETGFNLRTQFNGGDISYGQYIDQLQETAGTVDDMALSDEIKSQIKLSLNSEDVLADYNALVHDLSEIGFDDAAINSFLDSLSVEEFSAAAKIIPNLDKGTTLDEIQKLIDDQLAQDFKFDIKVQTEGIEALNTALAESRSAAGLTSESIAALTARYEDLDGFNAAALFEKTANGIRLNSDELNRLEEQYVNTNKLEIDKNLNTLVEKYQDLTEKIKTCTDAKEKETLKLERDGIADKIDELSTLASQYDGLTSAFTKWQNALNGAEEGDNYDSVFENLEAMKELDDKGLVGTDKYKTFAQLMSYEDLSSAGIDEIGNAFDKGYKKAERYFTEGQKGSKNFLKDLNKINSEWAHINKNGDWEVDINAEEAAKKLGISVEAVLLLLDKLKDYGIKVEVDNTSIDSLKTDIQESEEKLKNLGQTPHKVNLDIEANTENLSKIDTEIKGVKSAINEVNNNGSLAPEVKTAQLEDLRLKLEALIQKKQEASQPTFMSLNTSQVNASLVDALEKIQSYQTALNELNKLQELKAAGIGIDDSEIAAAEEKLDGFAKSIQGLDGDVKVAIGLEEDGSIDSIHKAFEEGKVKIDADTDPAVSKVGQLAETVEKISDKDITINVTVNGLDDVKELNKNIDIATKIDGDIDKLSEYVESAKALKDLGENITSYVTAEVKGNVIDEFEYKLNNLKVFSDSAKDIEKIGFVKSEVSADIKGNVIDEFEYKIDNLKVYSDSAKNVSEIGNVESTVKANIEGNVTDEFEYKINNLKVFSDSAKDIYKIGNVESNVKATINSGEDGDVIDEFEYKLNNLEKFAKYAKELQGLQDVDINIDATVNSGENGDVIDEFEYKLDNLSKFADYAKELQSLESVDVSVNATVNTGEDGDAVDEFEYKLNNLEVFAEGAKALQGIGNVSSEITAKVNTGESGDAIDTFEYKLNNLETFAEGARALQGIGNVSSTVTAEINSGSDGDVIDEFEYKLNNLEKFAQYAKDLQGVGSVNVSVSAKVNTGEDGDVTDTFEYKLNNLDEFASYAKELQGLEDVNITIKANVKTGEDSATNEWEYRLNNLDDFATYAKDLQGLESVDLTISANAKGNVVGEKTEGKINNLEVFAKGAKGLKGIESKEITITANAKGNVVGKKTEGKINNLEVFAVGAKKVQNLESKDITITANAKGNVVGKKTESKINNLEVFAKGAKSLQGISSKEVNITANADGNVVGDKTEGKINNLKVFGDSAKALNGVESKKVSITADANGNVVSGEGASSRLSSLTEFKSLISGMSNQTVTVSVTANVDAANINQAITLLTNVANSGVFKDYKATVQVGAKIATIDDTTVKNYKAPPKEGKVKYSVDSSKVDAWTAPSKDGVVNYSASVEALTDAQKHKTGTITYKANIIGFGGVVNGTANANGSAFANGTSGKAFKQGDWGVKKTTTALTGELGQELVVYKNRWYTVGDNGAEFATIPKGAIVFNHKQTEELFKNGKVTSDGGRGRALANGTAFASGTALNSLDNDGFEGNKDGETEFETFDWLETLLTRLERIIDDFVDSANDIHSSWDKRENALGDAISKNQEYIDKLTIATDKRDSRSYWAAAEAVDLNSSLKQKVREGAIDPNDDSISKDVAEKIREYQELYEKYLSADKELTEALRTQAEYYAQAFDDIISKYDDILQGFDHTESMIDEYINQAEAKGYIISKDYYNALKTNKQSEINKLIEEQTSLIIARNTAEANGIDKNSEEWYNMCAEIDDVTQAIESGTTALIEYDNAMRDIDWEVFDLIQERISDVAEEANFLIDLMSNDKLHNDDGSLTEQGLTTMGLHGQNYNTYMYAADEYANEIAKLDKQIADGELDGNSKDIIDRRRTLVELQRESILNAENEKQAIKDLVEEGINLELDALQERIDLHNEELDSMKDLYDYQKNVQEQTENIASLQKQLRAYEGFTDEETRATVQKLKVELESAQQDLQETEYDKFISDQSALLDELFLEYENVLNTRLDDINVLISDVITEVNASATTISNTLTTATENVGTTLSEAMANIWSDDGKAKSVIAEYSLGFQNKQTTTNLTLDSIKEDVNAMVDDVDKDAQAKVTANKTSTSAKKDPTGNSSNSNKPSSSSSSSSGNKSAGDGKAKIGDKVKFLSGKYYYDSQGVNPAGSKNHGKQVYITNINKKSWATHPYHISTGKKLGQGDLGWLKLNQLSGYATGKKNFLDNEIAWTQENGQEFIVRPSDGAILTPIAKGDSVLTSAASSNIWDMANSPSEFIKDNLNFGTANVPNNSTIQSSYTQYLDKVVFNLPNVKNYDELLAALQKDPKFDKLIKAMTIEQIAGKSSLIKGKSIR